MIQRVRQSLALLPILALLAGCSSAPHSAIVAAPATSINFHGSIHGGQQPITGAIIQVYAVGTSGDGSAATSVLTGPVTTDGNGFFDLTNKVSCPQPTSLLYLVATGGNPGLPPPFSGPQISLITALGACNNPSNIQFINVNEVTTVAAIYALAPYMVDLTHIGSADTTGLIDAFAIAWQFADITSGSSPGVNLPTGVTVPTAQINTLANLLSSCVNSSGGVAGDTNFCGQFFTLLTPAGSTAPTNTAMALLNLALNPTLNTSGLYALTPATAPFQPTLTAQPTNFYVTPSPSPNFTATPNGIFNFGSLQIGATTNPATVTLRSYAQYMHMFPNISLIGPNTGDFIMNIPNDNSCSEFYTETIVAGCQFTVSFHPTAAGVRRAFIVIEYDNREPELPIRGSITIPLFGNGTVPSPGPVTVSPGVLNFSLFNVPQPVTVSNLGTTNLNISNISTAAPYSQTNNCGSVLLAQSICTVNVTLHPSASPMNSTVEIDDDASSSPQIVNLTDAVNRNGTFIPPDSLDFGIQSVGSTGLISFSPASTVSGAGSAALTITGTDAADFSFDPTSQQNTFFCSWERADYCVFFLYFKPSATGLRTAAIAAQGVGNIPISGTGVGAGPYFNMLQDIYGLVPYYSPYPAFSISGGYPLTFYLRRAGSVQNAISAPVVSGPHASEFSGTSNCPALGPQPCTVTLNFNPSTDESFTTTATIADSSNTYQITVPIWASYNGPTLISSPSSMDFQITTAGTVSAPQSFTINTPYNTPVTVTATVTGPFNITSGTSCTTPCQMSVAFAPPSTANNVSLTGSLNLSDPSGDSGSVSLTGYSVTPATISLSTNTLSFAARPVSSTSIAQTVTITNTSSTNFLYYLTPTLIGVNPGDYILTNNCISLLNPGSSCTMTVSFSPTATGTRTATLNLISTSATSPDQVTLTGTGQ